MSVVSVESVSRVAVGPGINDAQADESEGGGQLEHSELLFWGLDAEQKNANVWTFEADEKMEAELEELFQEVLGDDMLDADGDGVGEVWAY